MDPIDLTSSPIQSPAVERSAISEAIPTPMPGTNLAFEDILSNSILPPSAASSTRGLPGYFDIPLDDSNMKRADYSHIQFDHDAARGVRKISVHTRCRL